MDYFVWIITNRRENLIRCIRASLLKVRIGSSLKSLGFQYYSLERERERVSSEEKTKKCSSGAIPRARVELAIFILLVG